MEYWKSQRKGLANEHVDNKDYFRRLVVKVRI